MPCPSSSASLAWSGAGGSSCQLPSSHTIMNLTGPLLNQMTLITLWLMNWIEFLASKTSLHGFIQLVSDPFFQTLQHLINFTLFTSNPRYLNVVSSSHGRLGETQGEVSECSSEWRSSYGLSPFQPIQRISLMSLGHSVPSQRWASTLSGRQ